MFFSKSNALMAEFAFPLSVCGCFTIQKAPKTKQYGPCLALGRETRLDRSAKVPRVWQREALVNLCHHQVFYFAYRPLASTSRFY